MNTGISRNTSSKSNDIFSNSDNNTIPTQDLNSEPQLIGSEVCGSLLQGRYFVGRLLG